MSALGGITRPVTELASKALKADKVKSVKLKLKIKKDPGKPKDSGA